MMDGHDGASSFDSVISHLCAETNLDELTLINLGTTLPEVEAAIRTVYPSISAAALQIFPRSGREVGPRDSTQANKPRPLAQ